MRILMMFMLMVFLMPAFLFSQDEAGSGEMKAFPFAPYIGSVVKAIKIATT